MLAMILPAVGVVVFGGALLWYGFGQQGATSSPVAAPAGLSASEQATALADVQWPIYVSRGSQAIKEAYQFAVLRPDVLQHMPCYCGCGQHNGHKSNESCFVSNMNEGGKTIAFDSHGST